MRDARLEQHPAELDSACRRQDASSAATELSEADDVVAGLAQWCGDVLFGPPLIDADDRGHGLSVLAALLATQYPEQAFLGISHTERRQSLEAGFRALIEGHEHPRRDLMGWLFGAALTYALDTNMERTGPLLTRLWNLVKYDTVVRCSFAQSLRELMGRSLSARSAILELLDNRITDINSDPDIGVYVREREGFRELVDAWRSKPSIDRLRDHQFTDFGDDLLDMMPEVLPVARIDILHRLDRFDFPQPIDQILLRSSIMHDREEITAMLKDAPASSDDGRTWNHRLLALLLLQVVDNHCDALWRALHQPDAANPAASRVMETAKDTLLPWFKQLGSVVMARADAKFLGPQWLFMKVADERMHRAAIAIGCRDRDPTHRSRALN